LFLRQTQRLLQVLRLLGRVSLPVTGAAFRTLFASG
jgi:hypothetical protein